MKPRYFTPQPPVLRVPTRAQRRAHLQRPGPQWVWVGDVWEGPARLYTGGLSPRILRAGTNDMCPGHVEFKAMLDKVMLTDVAQQTPTGGTTWRRIWPDGQIEQIDGAEVYWP
jgi:hypothetical protein